MSTSHALDAPAREPGHGLWAALRDVSQPPSCPEAASGRADISPELALVCPELRRQAMAALPERDPDGFLPAPPAAPPGPLRVAIPDRPVRPRRPAAAVVSRIAVAAGAYLAIEAARTVAYAAGLTGGVVGVMSLAELFRG